MGLIIKSNLMKIKILTGVCTLGFVLFNCSPNEFSNNENITTSKNLSYNHIVEYQDFESASNKADEVNLYLNGDLYADINYTGSLNYNTIEFNNKYRVENAQNSLEYFEIINVHISTQANGSELITFDVSTSDGRLLQNLSYEYFSPAKAMVAKKGCPWCWVTGIVITIVDAVVDMGSESDCQTAIKACRDAGGLPSTTIEEGLFGNSCSVTCNPKS